MKDVQCYELFEGIAPKNHAFFHQMQLFWRQPSHPQPENGIDHISEVCSARRRLASTLQHNGSIVHDGSESVSELYDIDLHGGS